jgi:hypothetical protein
LLLEYTWVCDTAEDGGTTSFLLTELDLKEVTLRKLHISVTGFVFNNVYELRRKIKLYDARSEIEDNGWTWVVEERSRGDEITSRLEEGDSISIGHEKECSERVDMLQVST